jgi:uncharacterized protein (DUF927 family)
MNYVVKWGQYMQTIAKADQMRMQMGWTENISEADWDKRSFVIGTQEILRSGEVVDAPSSPFVRGIAKYLVPHGTYDRWRESADYLDNKGFEMHAFTMLCGLASPFMTYTSTSGVVVCLLGKSGSAKTGAMYAGLSAWGHPKELSVFDATDNGMVGRFLGLHNIPLGVDEISNKDGKVLSQFTKLPIAVMQVAYELVERVLIGWSVPPGYVANSNGQPNIFNTALFPACIVNTADEQEVFENIWASLWDTATRFNLVVNAVDSATSGRANH